MITVFKHENGATSVVDRVEAAWLKPDSDTWIWVNLDQPTPDEAKILTDVFHFHELAVEDALSEMHHPKIESYGAYLYLILHGIDFKASEHCFKTRDVDFFLGPNYLVTIHSGISRSIGRISDLCRRNERVLGEGPGDLLYRIVDTMVDNYLPEVEELSHRLDALEDDVFDRPNARLVRDILEFKRDVASLRQIVLPQRDAVGRLARREFPFITEALAYRFRDVHDHLVRLADESMFFQDRVTEHPRRAPLGRVEPVECGDEGPHDHRDAVHAADVHYGHVRHERAATAPARRTGCAVLVGDEGHHAVDVWRHALVPPGAGTGSEAGLLKKAS